MTEPHLAYGQSEQTVGLELVLLVDVSGSVSPEEFRLQINGLATAFRDPIILEAISISGGVAVCAIQWAHQSYQYKFIDWTLLQHEVDALKLSERIAAISSLAPSGSTAIGDALEFGLDELNSNRYKGLRRVIDLSGDGYSNDGRLLRSARSNVLQQGVTINGLAILNEVSELKEYFRTQLIGGPGAFVITAQDYFDFPRAIREKLNREIRPAPIGSNSPDKPVTKTLARVDVQDE